MTIDELAKMVHENAVAHGFWRDGEDVCKVIPEKLALIHSEISEALEAFRDGDVCYFESAGGKPDGFGVELADAVIRIFDLYERFRRQCEVEGTPQPSINALIERKHMYNVTRPHKHGKVC